MVGSSDCCTLIRDDRIDVFFRDSLRVVLPDTQHRPPHLHPRESEDCVVVLGHNSAVSGGSSKKWK